MTDAHWDTVERLTAFSEERGHTLLELAFSWLAVKPEVASVIAGATKPSRSMQTLPRRRGDLPRTNWPRSTGSAAS